MQHGWLGIPKSCFPLVLTPGLLLLSSTMLASLGALECQALYGPRAHRSWAHPHLPTIALANHFQNPIASIYNRYHHLGVAQLLTGAKVLEAQTGALG